MNATDFNELLNNQRSEEVFHYLSKGHSMAEINHISEEQLESLYSIAYNLYTQNKYKEAAPLFQMLTMLDHYDTRFSLGLGGCYQMMQEYEKAIEIYAVCYLADIDNPTAAFYVSKCFMRLGKKEEALSALLQAKKAAAQQAKYMNLLTQIKNYITLLQQD